MVGGLATSKPSYDVSKHIEYIVGINDKDFFEARQDPKMVFRAVKVHIRHEEFEYHKMFLAKWQQICILYLGPKMKRNIPFWNKL